MFGAMTLIVLIGMQSSKQQNISESRRGRSWNSQISGYGGRRMQ